MLDYQELMLDYQELLLWDEIGGLKKKTDITNMFFSSAYGFKYQDITYMDCSSAYGNQYRI